MKQRSVLVWNTISVAVLSAVSRFMGIARSAVQMRLLGLGAISDAFLAAWTIPSFLRRVVTDGALAAAFVPEFVALLRADKKHTAQSLMVWALLFFELLIISMAVIVSVWPEGLLMLIAPGFSAEQIAYAIPLVRILFVFMIFITASALLAGALNSVHSFVVSASGPIVLNGFYMAGLLYCFYMSAPITHLAWWIVGGGAVHMVLHVVYYWYYGFSFVLPDRSGLIAFGSVVSQIIPALLGVSMLELNVTIDKQWGSFLAPGAMTMIHYGNRFMGLPFGIFAVAFSTVILPHFSRVMVDNPKRLSFYLHESFKLLVWVMLPLIALMWCIAPSIFHSFLVSGTSLMKITIAAWVLRCYLVGLIFFGANRIMLSMLYALRDRTVPLVSTLVATGVNIAGNAIATSYGSVYGVALATTISAGCMTAIMLSGLLYRHAIGIRYVRLASFLIIALLHATLAVVICYAVYTVLITGCFLCQIAVFKNHYYYWSVIAIAVTLSGIIWAQTRHLFGIVIYFVS